MSREPDAQSIIVRSVEKPLAAGEYLQSPEEMDEYKQFSMCTFVGECTKVCPKNVNPAGAIQRYKLNAALESVKLFFLPRGA